MRTSEGSLSKTVYRHYLGRSTTLDVDPGWVRGGELLMLPEAFRLAGTEEASWFNQEGNWVPIGFRTFGPRARDGFEFLFRGTNPPTYREGNLGHPFGMKRLNLRRIFQSEIPSGTVRNDYPDYNAHALRLLPKSVGPFLNNYRIMESTQPYSLVDLEAVSIPVYDRRFGMSRFKSEDTDIVMIRAVVTDQSPSLAEIISQPEREMEILTQNLATTEAFRREFQQKITDLKGQMKNLSNRPPSKDIQAAARKLLELQGAENPFNLLKQDPSTSQLST